MQWERRLVRCKRVKGDIRSRCIGDLGIGGDYASVVLYTSFVSGGKNSTQFLSS